jgi:putative hemolysin
VAAPSDGGVLGKVTNFLVRMLGGQVKRGPFVTEEELRLLVTVGEEEGVLEEEETDSVRLAPSSPSLERMR